MYAKLFDLPGKGQVLLTKEETEDDGMEAGLKVRFPYTSNGLEIAASFGYPTEAQRDQVFDDFTEASAEEAYTGMFLPLAGRVGGV